MWAPRLQVTGCFLSFFSTFSIWSLLCSLPWMADSFMRAGSSGCCESEARLSLWPSADVAGGQGGASKVESRTSDPGVLGSTFLCLTKRVLARAPRFLLALLWALFQPCALGLGFHLPCR